LGVSRARRAGERAGLPLSIFFWIFAINMTVEMAKIQKKDFRLKPNATKTVDHVCRNTIKYILQNVLKTKP
jgi:hypothetical protein